MPVESKSRNRELVAVFATTAVMLGIYAVVQSRPVQDWWRAARYAEPERVAEIRKDLELTDKGERIFLATQPAVEEAESFNEHCNSHRKDVSLLGCYTNDKMYIYQVDHEELKDSNKVTAAHELLHAVWARMNDVEREETEKWLRIIQRQDLDWVEEELSLYNEEERLEELYTRVGTKLREIPDELEEHYREYFTDRMRIVEFYEAYQAPFEKLKKTNEELKAKIDKLGTEIEQNRAEYNQRLENLQVGVQEFNACAETEGCFASLEEFNKRKASLRQEESELNVWREKVNQQIDENNNLVHEYNTNQLALGELNNALNSNMEMIRKEEDE